MHGLAAYPQAKAQSLRLNWLIVDLRRALFWVGGLGHHLGIGRWQILLQRRFLTEVLIVLLENLVFEVTVLDLEVLGLFNAARGGEPVEIVGVLARAAPSTHLPGVRL